MVLLLLRVDYSGLRTVQRTVIATRTLTQNDQLSPGLCWTETLGLRALRWCTPGRSSKLSMRHVPQSCRYS